MAVSLHEENNDTHAHTHTHTHTHTQTHTTHAHAHAHAHTTYPRRAYGVQRDVTLLAAL
jgi:hypothetical protein